MSALRERLREHLKLPAGNNAELDALLEQGTALVDQLSGSASVPDVIREAAILTAARELETRVKSPGGIFAAFGDQDGAIRLARDPLGPVRPLLAPYLPGGFA